MTTSNTTVSALNHFLDVLHGISALLATARARCPLFRTIVSDFHDLPGVMLIAKGI